MGNRPGRPKHRAIAVVVDDEDRGRLLYGPYRPPPRVSPGQVLRCEIRGEVVVAGFSDGPIPWPLARNDANGGRGRGPYVVCGGLAEAVRRESSQAVQHWWGVGATTVGQWRRALGVEPFNEGTRRLWRCWRPAKLPRPSPEPVVDFSPRRLRARRLGLGLTRRAVAARAGWASANTYGQLEEGRRRRVTTPTLAKLAAALGCRPADLAGPA